MTKEQFIVEISKCIQKHAPKYNIKVYSPIIAQAILESGCGTSELAVNAYNYFGLNIELADVLPLAVFVIKQEQNKMQMEVILLPPCNG